jgi:DNA-binding transcriptional LysR family regulator
LLNFTIRQLEVFVSVIETGGFGLAAEQLNIAQTSVSAHIEAIEEQLGRTVFYRRSGRRPVLTDFGDMLQRHARTILAEVDAVTSELDLTRGHLQEQIVFACQRPIAHSMLPSLLARFTQEHPSIELITHVSSQKEVIDHMRNGRAHLGCFLTDAAPTAIDTEIIGSERYVLIASPQHPLAGRQTVSPKEIEGAEFVWPPRSSPYGKSLARILHDAGVRRTSIVSRATDYEVFREFVTAGLGIACCTEKSVAPDVAAGRVVILTLAAPAMTMQVRLCVSSKRTSAGVRLLVEQIRNHWR